MCGCCKVTRSVKLVKWLAIENHLSILKGDWALRGDNMTERDNVITATISI